MESFALHSLSTSTSFSLSSPRMSFLRRHSRPISKSHLSLSLNPNSSSIPSLKSTASHFLFFPSKSSLSSFNPLSKIHIVNQPIRGSSSSSSPSSPDAQEEEKNEAEELVHGTLSGHKRPREESPHKSDETKNLPDETLSGHTRSWSPSRGESPEKGDAKRRRVDSEQHFSSPLPESALTTSDPNGSSPQTAESKHHNHSLQTRTSEGVSDSGADELVRNGLKEYLRNIKKPTWIEMVGAAYLSKLFTTKSSSDDNDDHSGDNNDEIGEAIEDAVKAAKLMFHAEKLRDGALERLKRSKKLFS